MIGNADQDAFISRNKWAVITSLRSDGSPSSSVVFFAREGDELVFSTTKDRLKARTIANDPRVALTVLDEGAPYGYVTVEGPAAIEDGDIVPSHIRINEAMRGGAFTPPEGYEAKLRADGRVIIRVKAERVSGVARRG
ncbi:MAG: PPOX class F420-dependent oxidoreductase [Dehalococcoidia bacterium]